jgi:hypothetical protein
LSQVDKCFDKNSLSLPHEQLTGLSELDDVIQSQDIVSCRKNNISI